MEDIYNGPINECKDLGELVFDKDLHIDGEVIGTPEFSYAKTGKLFGKLDFVYQDTRFTILFFNHRYIKLMMGGNVKAEKLVKKIIT